MSHDSASFSVQMFTLSTREFIGGKKILKADIRTDKIFNFCLVYSLSVARNQYEMIYNFQHNNRRGRALRYYPVFVLSV